MSTLPTPRSPVASARLLGLILGAVLAPNAFAADKELLDILLANGAITAEQHSALSKKAALTKEDVEKVVVSLDKKGLNIASGDGDFEMKIGARLHVDGAMHSGETGGEEATDGSEFRRARIEMRGRFHRDWIWTAESDFADNKVSIKDFWLGFEGLPGMTVMAGHQKQPYSLAVEMSSNDIPFMERSIDNDLIIPFTDRSIGVRAESHGDHWFFAGGVFGDSIDPQKNDDEGWGTAGRFVLAPIVEADRIVHLGVRGAYRQPNSATSSIRMHDETTHFSNLDIVDTGDIEHVDGITLYGPEAALVYGPWSLSGEYNRGEVTRSSLDDLSFQSWHVAATWTLTGESRAGAYRIDAGEFKRLTGDHDFSLADGGWGAWELAARYARIDLNDGAFTGGEEDAFTAALNWYVNTNVRLMFDYTRIIDTDGTNAVRAAVPGLNVYQMRVQYTF